MSEQTTSDPPTRPDREPEQLDLFQPPDPDPKPFGTVGRPGFDQHGFPERY